MLSLACSRIRNINARLVDVCSCRYTSAFGPKTSPLEKAALSEPGKPVAGFQPKSVLYQIFQKYAPAIPPVYLTKKTPGGWKSSLVLNWPTSCTTSGVGQNKILAERNAALQALNELQKTGFLDEKFAFKKDHPSIKLESAQTGGMFDDLSQISGPLNLQGLHPKEHINRIYSTVMSAKKSKLFIVEYRPHRELNDYGVESWRVSLNLNWPHTFAVEGYSKKRSDAEAAAALKALTKLKDFGVLDKKLKPIVHSEEEIRSFISQQRAPVEVNISDYSEVMMWNAINKFNTEVRPLLGVKPSANRSPRPLADSDSSDPDFDQSEAASDEFEEMEFTYDCSQKQDVVTGRPYRELDERTEEVLSEEILLRHRRRIDAPSPSLQRIRVIQASFPIAEHKKHILKTIANNQVTILSGETGCGKTTQIPQYILDSYAEKGEGALCSIVCTQPRRISAVSIAERVAEERDEKVGDSVGYQVRLDSRTPAQPYGSVLFCSAGILLRRLQHNIRLDGLSHVIIDEAHERDLLTDFLLALIKDVCDMNPSLKVIIMSASLNAEKIARYYNDAPILNIPGFMYPVKQIFLPEIGRLLGKRHLNYYRQNEQRVDLDLVIDVIMHIDKTKNTDGAILCFLPGWQEIKQVYDRLKAMTSGYSHMIYPVHSRIPPQSQRAMFEPAPSGTRKIVLATNVAETSITINDVVYVVDPGRHKETTFNAERGVATLTCNWVSKANVMQRKGRAGRVKPGECYHLFSQEDFAALDPFPVPEIQRAPLEKVVLDTKLYFPDEKSEEFLSRLPDPPSRRAVSQAVKLLVDIGVLDSNENLTSLGRRICNFSTHPQLSRCLVYGALLGCADSALTIAASLTATRDIFVSNIENKAEIREIKSRFTEGSSSDHVATNNMYQMWENAQRKGFQAERKFCDTHVLFRDNLRFISGLKKLFSGHLFDARMIQSSQSTYDKRSVQNAYADKPVMIAAMLAAGLTPNYLRLRKGEIRDNRLIAESTIGYVMTDGSWATLQRDSINSKDADLDSPWLAFFHKMFSVERGNMVVVRDTTSVPSLSLLLFGGRSLNSSQMPVVSKDDYYGIEQTDQPMVKLQIDRNSILEMCLPKKKAECVVELRNCLDQMFEWFFVNSGRNNEADQNKEYILASDEINAFWDELKKTLYEVLTQSGQ